MPTDDAPDDRSDDRSGEWARDLMHRAAGTIEVGPGAPLTLPPPRRAWPVLAAAAAVAVIAAATTALVVGTSDETEPRPSTTSGPTPSPTASPTASPTPSPTPSPTAPQQIEVPELLGRDEAKATQLLEDQGFAITVSVRDLPGCQPDGMVIGQRPAAGATVEPGSEVVLVVNQNLDDFCGGGGDVPPSTPRST